MSTDPYFDLGTSLGCGRTDMLHACDQLGLKLVVIEKDRGDGRKAHYGAGRQPLDDILGSGWGSAFCAGNVLKYLRRDKDVAESRTKAKWYWDFMHVKENDEFIGSNSWTVRIHELKKLLTNEELDTLNG